VYAEPVPVGGWGASLHAHGAPPRALVTAHWGAHSVLNSTVRENAIHLGTPTGFLSVFFSRQKMFDIGMGMCAGGQGER